MAKVIRTTIDAEGNVSIDFSGFVGNECEAEEDRLRRSLAELGLLPCVDRIAHKQAAMVGPEVRSARVGK